MLQKGHSGWLVLALGLSAASCGSMTAPGVSLARQDDILVIEPRTNGLVLGAVETLRAVFVSPSGVRRAVGASWHSDPEDVAFVDGGGQLRAMSVGQATIRATFQNASATQVIRVVPNYAGTWKGIYKVASCTQSAGGGPSYCRFVIGSMFPLRACNKTSLFSIAVHEVEPSSAR